MEIIAHWLNFKHEKCFENKEYYNNIELKWQEKYYLVHLKGYMGP